MNDYTRKTWLEMGWFAQVETLLLLGYQLVFLLLRLAFWLSLSLVLGWCAWKFQ